MKRFLAWLKKVFLPVEKSRARAADDLLTTAILNLTQAIKEQKNDPR